MERFLHSLDQRPLMVHGLPGPWLAQGTPGEVREADLCSQGTHSELRCPTNTETILYTLRSLGKAFMSVTWGRFPIREGYGGPGGGGGQGGLVCCSPWGPKE